MYVACHAGCPDACEICEPGVYHYLSAVLWPFFTPHPHKHTITCQSVPQTSTFWWLHGKWQTDRLAPRCRLQHMIKDAIRPSYVASISNDAFSFRHQIYVAPDAKVKTPHERPTTYGTIGWLIYMTFWCAIPSLTWPWQRGGIEAYSESCDVTRLTYAICTWSIEWWCAATQFAPIPPLLPFVGLSNV